MIPLLNKLDRLLCKVEEITLALLLVGMVVVAGVQVLLRNIWNRDIFWADVALQNVTVLAGLLGASIATSEGRHLNIDLFSRLLKGVRAQLALRVVLGLFCVGACVILAKGGLATYEAVYAPWLDSVPPGKGATAWLWHELSEGEFPGWLSQLMIALGFVTLTVHFSLRLLRDLPSLLIGQHWERIEDAKVVGEAVLDEMARSAEEPAPKTGTKEDAR